MKENLLKTLRVVIKAIKKGFVASILGRMVIPKERM